MRRTNLLSWFAVQTGLPVDDTPHDLARIRLVTARYGELRGLINATMAVGLLLGMWSAAAWFGLPGGIWGIVPGALLAWLAMYALEHRYDEVFGRVRQCAPESWYRRLLPFSIAASVVIDGHFRGSGYPSTLFSLLAAGHAWVAVRDWPTRGYYAIAAGLTGTAAALYSGVADSSASHDVGLFTALTLLGVGTIITGLLDHRLLVTTLKPRAERGAQEEHVQSD